MSCFSRCLISGTWAYVMFMAAGISGTILTWVHNSVLRKSNEGCVIPPGLLALALDKVTRKMLVLPRRHSSIYSGLG